MPAFVQNQSPAIQHTFRPTVYYQLSTNNKSFVLMHQYLKSIGIKNNKFMLALLDKDLAGVDPHDPKLNQFMKQKILRECMANYWYFLREVVRIPDQGGTGAGATAPAGVNAPVKAEDDEHEKKVKINAYHEGAEEIDYKSKYAESEATMDDLVGMIEETAGKYTQLAEEYAKVVKELQAYKLVEAHSILLEDAMDLLNDYSYEEVVEELVRYEEGEVIAEDCEEKAEEKQNSEKINNEAEQVAEETEYVEEKEEEKKEEAEEKAEEKAEEIKESIDGEVIAEAKSEPYIQKVPTFSVFKREVVSESKPSRKAWSAFAD